MRATIVSRDPAKNTVNLDNKEVPGEMAAMKMDFELRGVKVTGGRRFDPDQLHQNPKEKSEGRKQKCFLLSARFEIRVQLGHDGIDCRSVSYSDMPRVRPSELLWLASAIEERDDRCGRELLIVSRGDHE